MTKKKESEFGKGLTYCLGLFLAHAERYSRDDKVKGILGLDRWPELWFNASSDHLYELEIPDSLPTKLKERLTTFRDKVLHWGHGFKPPEATEADVKWAIQEAKDLLRAIDTHWGVCSTIKGSWE